MRYRSILGGLLLAATSCTHSLTLDAPLSAADIERFERSAPSRSAQITLRDGWSTRVREASPTSTALTYAPAGDGSASVPWAAVESVEFRSHALGLMEGLVLSPGVGLVAALTAAALTGELHPGLGAFLLAIPVTAVVGLVRGSRTRIEIREGGE